MAETQQAIEEKLGDQFDPFPTEQAQPEPEQQATETEEIKPEIEENQESTEAEETVAETEETQTPYAEVEFNGKTYEVPEELKEALIQGADYTRKTQDVARQHEAADMRADSLKLQAENLEFENSLTEDRQLISLLDSQINQYKSADWSEFSDSDLMKHRIAMENLKEQKAEVEASIESRRAEWSGNQQKAIEDHMEKSSDWLRKSINGWNQDLANKVAQDAISIGYTEQEVNSIIDPRAVRSLYESMKYRELIAGTQSAKAKASQAAPVVKPGSVKKMPTKVREKLNYKKQMASLKKRNASEAETAEAIRKRLEGTIGNL